MKREVLSIEGAEHGLRDGDPKQVAEANVQALELLGKLLAD